MKNLRAGISFGNGDFAGRAHADIVAETRERANCFYSFFILAGGLGKLPTPGGLG